MAEYEGELVVFEEAQVMQLSDPLPAPTDEHPNVTQNDALTISSDNVCNSFTASSKSSCSSYVSEHPPPSYEEVMRGISEEEAIDALKKFARKSSCYGRSPPRSMKTVNIKSHTAHKYVLQTFYEERSESEIKEPYFNQAVDGPCKSREPTMWEIQVEPPKTFYETEIHKEIPHTASVEMCSNCEGSGEGNCSVCEGSGNVKCGACEGLGLIFRHNCQDDITGFDNYGASAPRHCVSCSGGQISCRQCFGKGKAECEPCLGNGRLKKFTLLTVKWKVQNDERIFSDCDLPSNCLCHAVGSQTFKEQGTSVSPFSDCSHEYISRHSRETILSHKERLKHAKILAQRHHVEEIVIAEVITEWKGKLFKYWVYGRERKVFCPDYPVKCSII